LRLLGLLHFDAREVPKAKRGTMPLEVGGALRFRLETRISRQIAAGSRQKELGTRQQRTGKVFKKLEN